MTLLSANQNAYIFRANDNYIYTFRFDIRFDIHLDFLDFLKF